MNNNNRQENKGREQKDQELQVIKVGIDLHARQVTFSRQVDQSVPQPAQRMHPRAFVQRVRRRVFGPVPGSHPDKEIEPLVPVPLFAFCINHKVWSPHPTDRRRLNRAKHCARVLGRKRLDAKEKSQIGSRN
jgi:hypothetical protein